MTLEGCKYSQTSHTSQSNISLNSGPSKDCSRRVSPALIAPSSEPEDDLPTSRNMTSIADSLVKVNASTPKSNSEALLNVASDEDDDDDDASDDSGDDPKKKGKKSSSSKSRRELPAGAVATLKQWLLSPEHFTHPYPTPQDQTMLMQKTGIDKKQLKNWFTNARRRIWKPMLKKQLEEGKLPDVVSNDTLNNSSTSVLPSQEVKTVPIASSVSVPGEDQSQQQQYTWQGQQQNYGDALPQGNTQLSSFTYMSQYPPSQLNDQQQQISSMNPSNSIGSLPQISSFGSAGQMLKTDSHAVLMELFARDQDLVRQAAKGAILKAHAATKNAVQANGPSLMLGGGNGSLLQSTKMSQAASVPSMNSWPHFSSVSSLNNLGSLAGVKSIHNLSGADLASQAIKKGSLPHIKSQENMGRADSYAFLEVFFDNNAMSGRGTKREREEDNDVGLSLDADESPVCHSKPMDVVSSMTRPAPLPLGDIDENDELKRNYDDALAARGLLSVSRSSEKLTDLPMQMQRTLSQEFLRHQFGGASLPSFCSFASWGQSQQSPWDAPQVTRHPGEDLVLKDACSSQEPNLYQPYQVLAPQAAASTPLSDPSMANASVEVPASTRCALCHQVNVDTQLRPCGHMFHGRCLKPSLQNAMGPPTCPIDNTPMQSAVLAVPADVRLDHLRGGA